MTISKSVLDVLHRYRQGQIKSAEAAANELATIIEDIDDGPLTTKALKSYLAAEIRGRRT